MSEFKPIIITLILGFSILGLVVLEADENKFGKQKFAEQKYEEAYYFFKSQKEKMEQLTPLQQAELSYYLAKSRLEMIKHAREKEDYSLIQDHKDYLLKSYQDLKRGEKKAKGELLIKIELELNNIFEPLLDYAEEVIFFLIREKNLDQIKRQDSILQLDYHLAAALDIDRENYLVHFFSARRFFVKQNYFAATAEVKNTIRLYDQEHRKIPDFEVALLYLDLAKYDFEVKKDLDKSLENIRLGYVFIENEENKLDKARKKFDPDIFNKLEVESFEVKKEMILYELHIYNQTPERVSSAIQKYKTLVKDNPQSFHNNFAYAYLLEDLNQERAIEYYEKALEIVPDDKLTLYNLALHHYNISLPLLNPELDPKRDSLSSDVVAHLKEAETYLLICRELDASDQKVIDTLISIYSILGEDEKAAVMKDLKLYWQK